MTDALTLQRVASAQLGFATAVPEPGIYALLLAGLGLIGCAAGRKQRKAAA